MRLRRFILALIAAAALAAGCAIEPPLHLRQGLKVIVKVLWKAEVYPEGIKPSGVTLYFFRDGEYYMQYTTAQVDSCTVQLEPGKYRLYMISQSPNEFAYMQFSNMTNFDLASVTVEETKSSWYRTRAAEEVLAANPEHMIAGVSDEFEIEPDKVQSYQKSLAEAGGETEDMVRYYTVRVPVYPKSIVSQFWVTIYSDNADVLRSVRASTSGMARTFNLTQGTTGDDECTQLITDWRLTIDDPVSRMGHLDGKITTFGFPRGEFPGPDRDPTLNVSTLLIDYSTIETYSFYVGDKITLSDHPPDGYRHLYRLVFGSVYEPAIHPPDVHPADESSGFDATVDDWGIGETVEVNM